ncbi:AlbA family DNA-binding domain-containing protein [Streptomyces erythrochromogenes]|uniref:AlbA family DNA-binding domain-containing protein n=1 Tax=Streptomyces erythrochromogenes TaxID=285574 RepID=UPI0033E27A94
MARSWTRLHEHLGRPMGPLTHGMIMDAVASKLGETDDLDWKKQLPTFVPKPGIWNEFAKDVTAMANTRGGLLVYGVTDDIEAVGIDLAEVNEQQLTQTLRNGVQPYLSGVDIIPLSAPGGGGPDFLIVDVAPSELAPHFQYGWEQKDKDRATFNAPYRVGSDTFYMSEHQVARAYQERFSRQARAETALAELVQQAASVVLGESVPGCAWLVVAGRPSRPCRAWYPPRAVPRPRPPCSKASRPPHGFGFTAIRTGSTALCPIGSATACTWGCDAGSTATSSCRNCEAHRLEPWSSSTMTEGSSCVST